MSHPPLRPGRYLTDDLGHRTPIPSQVERIVSLVPSLTEAIAASQRSALVGATDWCSRPADLNVARVRGTKNPNLTAIEQLQPDLVVANKEENRELDVRRLRDAGVPVYVTDIRTVPGAISSIETLWSQLRWIRPDWLIQARRIWCCPEPEAVGSVIIPIWRDPWMVVGSDTFTGDLVRRLGYENLYSSSPDRYPQVDLDELDSVGADLVILPDEPYVFTAADGPEAFTRTRTILCSGRLLTWYGPSLIEVEDALAALS